MNECKVIVNENATVRAVPCIVKNGRASYPDFTSASAKVRLPGGATLTKTAIAFGGLGALATFSAAQEGNERLIATEITGVDEVPLRYVIKDSETGLKIPVEFKSILGEVFTLVSPLPCAISHGSTLKSAEVSFDITGAESKLCGLGVAEWTLDNDGVKSRFASTFKVVKRLPVWTLTQGELLSNCPWIAGHRDRTDEDLGNLIHSALHMDVLRILRNKGVQEEDILNTEPLKPAHITACAYRVALNDDSVSKEKTDMFWEEFEAMIVEAMNSRDWYESPQNESDVVAEPVTYELNKFSTGLQR